MDTSCSVETLLATSRARPGARRSQLRLYLIGKIIAVVLAFTSPLAAKSSRISDFQDTITVEKDGSAVVTERITLAFTGEWHGIHRTIPIEYPGPSGTNYQLFINVASVTDDHGARLKYESSRSGANRDLKIYIPGAVDTERTVEIKYFVRNGTRFFH